MLTPGHRLDRYELLCPIASGGMATVWLARMRGKRGFEKLVAIKTIKTELIADASYGEMFLDEARLASRIHHPNVAQILDLGEEDETLYLVMEYVDGDSLAKMCRLATKKQRPFPLELALRVIADACAGLHSAHELKDEEGRPLGVVHRDVSPQNILVTSLGAAKVIDFGLAKAEKAEQRDAPDTQEGVVKGKIRYLAPEYVTGKGADRRADIWAVGICLYELVTGSPPFGDLGDIDVVRHLMGPDPAPKLDETKVPAALKVILQKSLAKEPDDRFPTALAMRRAIEVAITALAGETTTAEDVSQFISDVLPELAERRKRTVNKVMETVMSRPKSEPPSKPDNDIMMALVTKSLPPPPVPQSGDADADVLLTQRKSSGPPPAAPPPKEREKEREREEDARLTPATSLTGQLGARPRSRVGILFVGAVALIVCFGLFVWPGRETLLGAGLSGTSSSTATGSEPPPSATMTPIASASSPSIDIDTPTPRPTGSTSATAPMLSASGNKLGVASAAPAPSADAGAKWNYRPDNWGQEPSDPVAAALAAASAEKMLKAAPSATPPSRPSPATAADAAPP